MPFSTILTGRDLVLDPFRRSGSTLIAAPNTGRICNGVELDPLCVDLIVEVTGLPASPLETGQTFSDLRERRALDVKIKMIEEPGATVQRSVENKP